MPAILTWDSAVVWDSPLYTWDGELIVGTFKDALYGELIVVLSGLVAEDHIHLDMRLSPEPHGLASWVVFRRITEYVNQVGWTRERWELEVIVPQGRESTLQAVCETLRDSFSGSFRSIGTYRTKCHHINTIERFDTTLQETSSLLVFSFYHRGEV